MSKTLNAANTPDLIISWMTGNVYKERTSERKELKGDERPASDDPATSHRYVPIFSEQNRPVPHDGTPQ